MARRRKYGARTRSGRLSRAYATTCRDNGTEQVQARRLALCNGSPAELSGSVLGILLANGHISVEQYRAGERYAWLRAVSFGLARPDVSFDHVDPYSPRLRSDEQLARLRERFEAVVGRLGRDQKHALDVIVIETRLPGWFRRVKLGRGLSPADDAEREALLSGLKALAKG
jgi:hypothetical protein